MSNQNIFLKKKTKNSAKNRRPLEIFAILRYNW